MSVQIDLFQSVANGRVGRRRFREALGDRKRHRAHRVMDLPRIRSPREFPLAQERCVSGDSLLQRHGDGTARAAGRTVRAGRGPRAGAVPANVNPQNMSAIPTSSPA